ncbi:hypothetical protein WGR79_14720 [Klebsiella pneumoniae]|uniref:hypothetical protein n=1 Tax=Klebsiella pneumoniae TaxID=573 RepID=UPI0037C0A42E
MSIQRREVYLVLKQLSDGRLFYVEGLRSARNYFFDGHVRVLTSPAGSASFIEFEPGERPMQLFHLPDEEGTQWQAAFHDFGCSPELENLNWNTSYLLALIPMTASVPLS